MKLDEIHNVAVFFSMGGKTLALRMTPEQKKIVALFALNSAVDTAKLIPVPHMTLPADPEMQEAL